MGKSKWGRHLIMFAFFGLFMFFMMARGGCPQQPSGGRTQVPAGTVFERIEVAGRPLYVEVANSPEEHRKGLKGRDSLIRGHGMLFVFDAPGRPAFLMKETHIALSLAFICENGEIKEIEDTAPGDRRLIKPEHPIKYALGVRQGFFDDYDAGIGTVIELPEHISYSP